MSRRRLRHRNAEAVRLAQPRSEPEQSRVVVREASRVERLAYTRSQAAEALGVSRSTFIRRVLPLVETVEMPWGGRLIPVDELQRLVAARRRPARARQQPRVALGRRAMTAPSIVERIRREHAAGRSLGQIARALNDDGVECAHGGRQWWPSTVRAVLVRAGRRSSAAAN